MNSINCIPNNSTGNKRQWLTPSVNPASCSASPEHVSKRNIQINTQYRMTSAVVSTHRIHLSKVAVPEKAQSWTNKIKCSKTLPKGWSAPVQILNFISQFVPTPVWVFNKTEQKTYILDKPALAAVKSCVICNV